MATAILPHSIAALPFLFARPQPADSGWNHRSAFLAAAAAEQADDSRRNTRGRIAYLLCELGFQLARRRIDPDAPFPLERAEVAAALGVSLCRVKRTLALLSLSEVVASEGGTMKVLDWPRLCGIAGYDLRRLELKDEDDDPDPVRVEDEPRPQHLTRAGDPACFV